MVQRKTKREKVEVTHMKKMVTIAVLLSLGLTARIPTATAQGTSTLVKVPFAFVAGNQVMPAGTYVVQSVTNDKAGVDAMGVVTLRGRDVKSYATFVAMLGVAESQGPKLTFKRTAASAILMEVQSSGKKYVMPRSKRDSNSEVDYHFEEIPANEVAILYTGKI
jgi:hypothetical protein